MTPDLTFAVIGGDTRHIALINQLALEGYLVHAFGYGDYTFEYPHVIKEASLHEALNHADIVVGPIPFSHDGIHLFAKFHDTPILLETFLEAIPKQATLFVGRIIPALKDLLANYWFSHVDLLNEESLAIMNAIPTGEGAIQVAMENSDITIHGSKCIVLGHGRCGKALAFMLRGIGANVTVVARKEADLALIQTLGYHPLDINEFSTQKGDYEFIFNTIPSMVLPKEVLSLQKKDCLIIDLASAPGGVDFNSAKELNIKALLSLNLPGKVAPKTAAQIIKNTIFSVLIRSE